MTKQELERVYAALEEWCRARSFAGYDPFDALNSRLFERTRFGRWRAARLAVTQILKRSPVNLRPLLGVETGKNPKGMALFALAALARFRTTREQKYADEAQAQLSELLSVRLETARGVAWGYNFDWQSRNFFAPRGTPTLVPTAFAARAFFEAAGALSEPKYMEVAESVCAFIHTELPRSHETAEEVCFSYITLAETRIYNASLLAGEILAAVGAATGNQQWCGEALRAARYVVRRQREDGAWTYGAEWYQSWIDNFHTAFILLSLRRIVEACGATADGEMAGALARGEQFWRDSFFLADGWPKYYHDRTYPADIHSAAVAIVAFSEFGANDPEAARRAQRVAAWTLRHMRSPEGYFYYQRRRFHTVRTPYMRWAQAWMLYALAKMLEGVVSRQ